MSRKDTIIIAVLINTGLLALLFMMATTTNIEGGSTIPSFDHNIVAAERTILKEERPVEKVTATRDELDQVLKNYKAPTPAPVAKKTQEKKASTTQWKELDEAYVEVTVKRGDALEKIARHNGTTVSTIMRANNLTSERIDIGQVLRIPVTKTKVAKAKKETKPAPVGTEFYTVKSGDNPWKIAKQFHVKFDQLLVLNNLNEESARRIKPGDTLRVR